MWGVDAVVSGWGSKGGLSRTLSWWFPDRGPAFLPRTLLGPATGTFGENQSLAFRTLGTALAGSRLLLSGVFHAGVGTNKVPLGGFTPAILCIF